MHAHPPTPEHKLKHRFQPIHGTFFFSFHPVCGCERAFLFVTAYSTDVLFTLSIRFFRCVSENGQMLCVHTHAHTCTQHNYSVCTTRSFQTQSLSLLHGRFMRHLSITEMPNTHTHTSFHSRLFDVCVHTLGSMVYKLGCVNFSLHQAIEGCLKGITIYITKGARIHATPSDKWIAVAAFSALSLPLLYEFTMVTLAVRSTHAQNYHQFHFIYACSEWERKSNRNGSIDCVQYTLVYSILCIVYKPNRLPIAIRFVCIVSLHGIIISALCDTLVVSRYVYTLRCCYFGRDIHSMYVYASIFIECTHNIWTMEWWNDVSSLSLRFVLASFSLTCGSVFDIHIHSHMIMWEYTSHAHAYRGSVWCFFFLLGCIGAHTLAHAVRSGT